MPVVDARSRERGIGKVFRRTLIFGLVVLLASALVACTAFWLPGDVGSTGGSSGYGLAWTIEDLSLQAQCVVKATVTGIESVVLTDALGTDIVTDVTLSVLDYIKGAGPGTLTIRVKGGSTEELAEVVSNEPVFAAGETTVVFVGPHSTEDSLLDGRLGVVGAIQGKLTVLDGRIAELSIPVAELLLRVENALTGTASGPEPRFLPMAPRFGTLPWAADTAPLSYSYGGLRWKSASLPVKYYTNVSSLFSGAVTASSDTWNAVGTYFQLKNTGKTTLKPRGDNWNVVYSGSFGNTQWLAQTITYYVLVRDRRRQIVDQYITECDLQINTYYRWGNGQSGSYFDIQNVATHEFGHWVLLNDLYTASEKDMTMYGYAGMNETKKRSLEPVEHQGLIAIYGKKP